MTFRSLYALILAGGIFFSCGHGDKDERGVNSNTNQPRTSNAISIIDSTISLLQNANRGQNVNYEQKEIQDEKEQSSKSKRKGKNSSNSPKKKKGKKERVKVKKVSGFPEFSQETDLVMTEKIIELKQTYMKYGFWPKDSRLVEPMGLLSNKGIEGKVIYVAVKSNKYHKLTNRLDNDDDDKSQDTERVLGISFDHTLPLARDVYQNNRNINKPYRRFAIGKVYRGETPDDKNGRHNEFYQSDIDVITDGKLSFDYDAEMPAIIYDIFRDTFKLNNFIIRINNRKLLEGLFRHFGLTEIDKIKKAIKIIDNIEKVDLMETYGELEKINLGIRHAQTMMKLFRLSEICDPVKFMNALKTLEFENSMLNQGIDELDQVIHGIEDYGVPKENFRVWLSIARGLDYYDGTVYETYINDMKHLGSVCSGGRYENLVGSISQNYNNKLPGVGISIGLTRLVPALYNAGIIKLKRQSVAQIIVTTQDPKCKSHYKRIARSLREEGLRVEEFHHEKGKLKPQLKYASNSKCRYVILANQDEINRGVVNVRDMNETNEKLKQKEVKISELPQYFKQIFDKEDSIDEKDDLQNDDNKFSALEQKYDDIKEDDLSVMDQNQDTDMIVYKDEKRIRSILEQTLFPKSNENSILINHFPVRQELSEIIDKIDDNSVAVIWYLETKSDAKQSFDYYKSTFDSLQKKNCTAYLLEFSSWLTFRHENTDLMNKNHHVAGLTNSHRRVIHACDFFGDLLHKTNTDDTQLDLLKDISMRSSMYEISKKFEGTIKLKDIVGEDSSLGKLIDLNTIACKTYSLFQYYEFLYIVSYITQDMPKEKNFINFILPNNELEYYPQSNLKEDLDKYLDNIDVDINFYCFNYGQNILDRPYIYKH